MTTFKGNLKAEESGPGVTECKWQSQASSEAGHVPISPVPSSSRVRGELEGRSGGAGGAAEDQSRDRRGTCVSCTPVLGTVGQR